MHRRRALPRRLYQSFLLFFGLVFSTSLAHAQQKPFQDASHPGSGEALEAAQLPEKVLRGSSDATPRWLLAQPYVLQHGQARAYIDERAGLSLHDINTSSMDTQLQGAVGLGAGLQLEAQTNWEQASVIAPISMQAHRLGVRLRLGPQTPGVQPSLEVSYRQQSQKPPQLSASALYAHTLTHHLHAMAGFDYKRNLRGIYHLQTYTLLLGLNLHNLGPTSFPIAYALEAALSFVQRDSIPRTRIDVAYSVGPSVIWPVTSQLYLFFAVHLKSTRRTEQDVTWSQYAIVPQIQLQWLSWPA